MDTWTPTREWEGQEAYLIGGGPSLFGFDFHSLPYRTIGCNDAFHLGPAIIHTCIFGDMSWWQRNKWDLEKFTGRIVTACPGMMNLKVPRLLKMKREKEGVHQGDTLGWNFSTGAMAINLAISMGAKGIFLLGYDLNSSGGRSHWHQYNAKPIIESSYQKFLRGFRKVAEGVPKDVQVFNVTDGSSRLDCFEKMSFLNFRSAMIGVPA